MLTARIALRVAPLAAGMSRHDTVLARRLTLAVWRAIALGRSAPGYKDRPRAMNAATAAYIAADAAATPAAIAAAAAAAAAAYAAAAYAYAAADATAAAAATATATAAATAAAAADDAAALWSAIDRDCETISRASPQSARLLASPLWPEGIPPAIAQAWKKARSRPDATAMWSEWHRWYERRLKGYGSEWGLSASGERAMAQRLIEADGEFWKRGEEDPAIVNNQIAAWRKELTRMRKPARRVDFFISYASADEATAREVAEVLHAAGFSTFAMFKDIPAGANFVDEVNRGLRAASSVMPLYSRAYVGSKHCLAELYVAYHRDPLGERRFLRPLELQHCELPALAGQVVYTSLVGCSADERRERILALAMAGPGRRNREQLLSKAREAVSPDVVVNAAGQLELRANPHADLPERKGGLQAQVEELKMLLPGAIAALKANHPPHIGVNLGIYLKALETDGEAAAWGALDRPMSHAETSFLNAEKMSFDCGLHNQLTDIFAIHRKIMRSLRDADERHNTLVEIRVDEDATGNVIGDAIDAIAVGAEELAKAGLTDKSFDEGIAEQVRQGREQQYAPPPLPAPEPVELEITEELVANANLDDVPVRAVSAKKAWIVGAWGVITTTYDLVAKLPSAAEAVGMLKIAIDALLALIHK